ncbi:hypothetical protein H4R19_005970, partial [Coemansia spiralis]
MVTAVRAEPTGFWPRLFRRASDIPRKASAGDSRWQRRPHADSAASAATAVDPALLTAVDEGKSPTLHPSAATLPSASDARELSPRRKQRRLTRRVQLSALPELRPDDVTPPSPPPADARVPDHAAATPAALYSVPPAGIVGAGDGCHEDGFWSAYDQRLGVGGDGDAARVILDAMVDDVLCTGGVGHGWRMEPNQGTFNDVLDSGASSIHPIVLTFARAHIENMTVVLAPEHFWLAIVQGLAGVLRTADPHPQKAAGLRPAAAAAAAASEDDGTGAIDLPAV